MPTSSHARIAATAAAALLAALVAACSGGQGETDPCVPIVNGLVVFQPGLLVQARDAGGRGEMLGTTAIVHGGTDSLVTVGRDTLQAYAGYNVPGVYTLRVRRRYYRDAVVSSITVNGGTCGSVATVTVPVTLDLATGAPALRAVDVLGAGFLNGPGSTLQLTPRFDADPAVPRGVLWRVNDTTQATVDANGVLTAKCVTAVRYDTVTVIATADTTVRGSAPFGVGTTASCP